MKTEFIVGFDQVYVTDLLARFPMQQEVYALLNRVVIPFDDVFTFQQFATEVTPYTVIRQREGMEVVGCPYVHFIPYIAIRNRQGDFYTYQRGKMGGEGRLAGNDSVGVGGHVDLLDVSKTSNELSVQSVLMVAADREFKEEVEIKILSDVALAYAELTSYSSLGTVLSDESRARGEIQYSFHSSEGHIVAGSLVPRGLIIDHVDKVGQVHLGILTEIWLMSSEGQEEAGVVVRSKEDVIIDRGFFSADDLFAKHARGEFKLEGWSDLALTFFSEEDQVG